MYRRPLVKVTPTLAHETIEVLVTNLVHRQYRLVAFPTFLGRGNVTLQTKYRLDTVYSARLLQTGVATGVSVFRQRHRTHPKERGTLNVFFG
jgi:hypothetical protein